MKIALYKATRPGIYGLYNRAVRLVTQQPYSHCELLFADGVSGSSSYMDGGVRLKAIEYGALEHWDFIELDDSYDEDSAREWFVQHAGERYDLPGALHFLLGLVRDDPHRWFCSEAIAAALAVPRPALFHPGTLAALGWRTRAIAPAAVPAAL